MSLKIKNKEGKVVATLEDDFTEPEIDEEFDKELKKKKKKQQQVLAELVKLTEELGLYEFEKSKE